MKYRFADFVLDEDRFELLDKAGNPLPLQARALELLLLLVRSPGVTISKQTILREVWGRENISPSALPSQVLKLRRALGDDVQPYSLLETIPRKGLRFTRSVETEAGAIRPHVEAAHTFEADTPNLAISNPIGNRPSIAILPFRLDDENALSGQFARAVPTDIIAALSRLNILQIKARSSTFLFEETQQSPLLVKSLLGARYSLTGSIMSTADRVEMYVELTENSEQSVVWCDVFKCAPYDLHDARSELVNTVVHMIEAKVSESEARRTRLSNPNSLTAWGAYHLGLSFASLRGSDNRERAKGYLRRAVAIDPDFTRAWSEISYLNLMQAIHGPPEEQKSATTQMLKAAERAYDSDPNDPSANLMIGWSQSYENPGSSPASWFRRSVEIAPSFALAHRHLGGQLAFDGDLEGAVLHAETGLTLNPQGMDRFLLYRDLAIAKFMQGDVPDAIDWGLRASDAPFDEMQILLIAVIARHLKGDTDEAVKFATRVKSSFPAVSWKSVYGSDLLIDKFGSMIEPVFESYGID